MSFKDMGNFLLRRIYVAYAALVVLAYPALTFAGGGGGGQRTNPNPGGQQIPEGPSGVLRNPLAGAEGGGITDIPSFLEAVINIVVIFLTPIIILMIVYAGFMYVTAQGNAEKVKKAHYALLYALIGGVLILGATALMEVIQGTVDDFRG